MPIVKNEITISGVSIDQVWSVFSDFKVYSDIMEDVLSVRHISSEGNRSLTEWKVLLNGSEMGWIEETLSYPPRLMEFNQTEGDLEVYQGRWTLEPVNDSVSITLEIEFNLGIPSLAETLNPLGISAINSNSTQMLNAIKKKCLLEARLEA